jgi:polyphosphate glucokinase
LNEYLSYLESLFSPDLFILGGGVIKDHDKFVPLLKLNAELVPAQLLNDAGIVGAALAARSLVND